MTTREALKIAIGHIEHMASWIALRNKDSRKMSAYSFESLGEDMPGLREAITASASKGEPVGYLFQPDGAAPDKWGYSHGARPDFDQGAYWTVKPLYTSPPPAAGWDEAIQAAAKILDGAAQDWNRIRDPGMANNARSYAKKIRTLRREAPALEGVAKDLADISTGQLFNALLSRINFDGMDPRTFSLAELKNAIDGAEWPR